jgi:hypothetical protein
LDNPFVQFEFQSDATDVFPVANECSAWFAINPGRLASEGCVFGRIKQRLKNPFGFRIKGHRLLNVSGLFHKAGSFKRAPG